MADKTFKLYIEELDSGPVENFYGSRLYSNSITQKDLFVHIIQCGIDSADSTESVPNFQHYIAGSVAVVGIMEKQASVSHQSVPIISEEIINAFDMDVTELTVDAGSVEEYMEIFWQQLGKMSEEDQELMANIYVAALGRSTPQCQLGFLMGAIDTLSYFRKAEEADKLKKQFNDN